MEILMLVGGVICMLIALVGIFASGKNHKLLLIEGCIIAGLLIITAFLWINAGIRITKGSPRPLTETRGAFVSLSRVNDGENSYIVVKDAEGKVKLLQGKAIMPDLKSFTIQKGKVVEFK